jgi:hypothetical protein
MSSTVVIKAGEKEFELHKARGRSGRLAMARILGAADKLRAVTDKGGVFDETVWSQIEDILPDLFCTDEESLEDLGLVEIIAALPDALGFHIGEAESPEVEEALKNSPDTAEG